jgi:hypothetical protein
MNSTSCPRRFGWIETNWRRRIVEFDDHCSLSVLALPYLNHDDVEAIDAKVCGCSGTLRNSEELNES